MEGKLEGKDHLQELGGNGSVIFKWIFNKEHDESVLLWNCMAEDMDKWRAVLTTAVNLLVPSNAGNFFSSRGISFAIMVLLHGLSYFEYISSFLGFLANFSPFWRCDPKRAMASSFLMFLDHTQRRSTVGRAPMDE